MLLVLILLLKWRVTTCMSLPAPQNTMLRTDDEDVRSDVIKSYRGQPEQEIALNLPTDEEAFNEIKPILQSGNPYYYTGGYGHFISSSFPEVDARGFHESVFDDLDDLYPMLRRRKRYDPSMAVSARGFHGDIFTDGFGSFHPVKRNDKNRDAGSSSLPLYYIRGKRSPHDTTDHQQHHHTPDTVALENLTSKLKSNINTYEYNQNQTISIPRHKRSWNTAPVSLPDKRKPEMTANGFHSDMFGNLGDFDPLRKRKAEKDLSGSESNFDSNDLAVDFDSMMGKRAPEMDKGGFHNDVFNDNSLGNFDTLKRAPHMTANDFHNDLFDQNFGNFATLKRSPDMGDKGFHNDVFHKSFGNFETLRKRAPAGTESRHFNNDAFNRDFGHFDTLRKRQHKVNTLKSEFMWDLPDRDWGGSLYAAGKRKPNAGAVNGDAFHSNFGIFETLRKRSQPADNDVFFDEYYLTKNIVKRKPATGDLNGDAFHRGFGNFDTMKRTLGGDAFHSQFGKFETMKRDSSAAPNRWPVPWSVVKYVESPHQVDRLRSLSALVPHFESAALNYERFGEFFRNYALKNKFSDMTYRIQGDEKSSVSSRPKSKNNTNSTIH